MENQRDESKPFHRLLSVEPPHPPYEAPADLQAAWAERDIQLPTNFHADSDEARVSKVAQAAC